MTMMTYNLGRIAESPRDRKVQLQELERLETEIALRKAKISTLNEKEAEYGSLYSLAVLLHKKLCHANHTDGCSWEYEFRDEMPDWNASIHSEYLHKARLMLGFLNKNEITADTLPDLINLL